MKLFSPIVFFALSIGSAVSAATVSNVVVGNSSTRAGPGIDGSCATGFNQTSATFSEFEGFKAGCATYTAARVGGGFVTATASEDLFGGHGNTRNGSSATSTVTYFFDLGVTDKYVYEGPERVTINLDYSTTAISEFSDPLPNLFTTGASSLVSGFASLTGSTNNINLQTAKKEFSVSSSVSRDTTDTDSDKEVIFGDGVLSLSIMTDPRRTLSLTMNIGASVNVVGPNSASVSALANGGQTLNFAENRPVFEVSDGLLVDFAAVNIVGNRWVDPRDTAPSPVPLPSAIVLMIAGLGFLGSLRRLS